MANIIISNSLMMQLPLRAVFGMANRKIYLSKPPPRQIHPHKTNQPRPQRVQQQKVEKNEYEMYGFDLRNFNYLDGLPYISQYEEQRQAQWLSIVQKVYQAHDFTCWHMLREKQEKVIQSLGEQSGAESRMLRMIDLKLGVALKFRKYEEMVVDLANKMQALKLTHENNEVAWVAAYRQKTAVLIMSDHDELHKLLIGQQTSRKKRNRFQHTVKNGQEWGYELFSSASKRIVSKIKDVRVQEEYCETVLLQCMGLLVLGERATGFEKLTTLTQPNIPVKYKNQAFTLLLLASSFENTSKKSLSQKLRSKLLEMSALTPQEGDELSRCYVSTKDCLSILESIVVRVHNRTLTQLQLSSEVRCYRKLLYFLAQNSYIEGEEEESSRLITFLDTYTQQFQDKQMKLMSGYFQMGFLFDKNRGEEWLAVFEQFTSLEQNSTFYDINMVGLDYMRVNFYRIAARMYQARGNTAKAKELNDTLVNLETTLSLYTLKELEPDENNVQKNWKDTVQQQLPYYYLDLGLERLFKCDWK